MSLRSSIPAALLLVSLAIGPLAAQEDPLAAARDLYAAAAYEDALSLLNRLLAESADVQQHPRIEQYRAFCLLALGRTSDAEKAIEALVTAVPSYRPSESEVSPRVRVVFSNVRRRVLPEVVQQLYAEAKQAYDEKAYAQAVDGFAEVLALLADPDLAPLAGKAPLSDVGTLANGFHELAIVAATPPTPPAPELEAKPLATPASQPAAPRVYSVGDAGVVPPVTLRQTLPPFPGLRPGAPLPPDGVIDVVISEAGIVESAVMRTPITPTYDQMVQNAVRSWRFLPATRQGVPVKFRKIMQISIKR